MKRAAPLCRPSAQPSRLVAACGTPPRYGGCGLVDLSRLPVRGAASHVSNTALYTREQREKRAAAGRGHSGGQHCWETERRMPTLKAGHHVQREIKCKISLNVDKLETSRHFSNFVVCSPCEWGLPPALVSEGPVGEVWRMHFFWDNIITKFGISAPKLRHG